MRRIGAALGVYCSCQSIIAGMTAHNPKLHWANPRFASSWGWPAGDCASSSVIAWRCSHGRSPIWGRAPSSPPRVFARESTPWCPSQLSGTSVYWSKIYSSYQIYAKANSYRPVYSFRRCCVPASSPVSSPLPIVPHSHSHSNSSSQIWIHWMSSY